jgi:hypothetical protein
MAQRKTIPIDPKFFCDGPYYLLTSSSLGGLQYTEEQICDDLLQTDKGVKQLLNNGVALPLFFPGDCALDKCTIFVLGDLTAKEEKNWVGKLSWKLKIPCGKLLLLAGGGIADELSQATIGEPPDEHFVFYQSVNVPPDEYLVELYAYLPSMSVQVHLKNGSEQQRWCQENCSEDVGAEYIIRLAPLKEQKKQPALPALVKGIGWPGELEYKIPGELARR